MFLGELLFKVEYDLGMGDFGPELYFSIWERHEIYSGCSQGISRSGSYECIELPENEDPSSHQ